MLNKIKKILEQNVCDHCLGRQFAQLLTGYSNDERGLPIRNFIAFEIDSKKNMQKINSNNFYGFKFRNIKIKTKKEPCEICNDYFKEELKYNVNKIKKKMKPFEFKTFLVGTTISKKMSEREEGLWKKIGVECCEPLKSEINRETGKLLEKETGKKVNLKTPDMAVHIDLRKNKITVRPKSVYVFGYYQKMKRGIPQTRWPGKYKSSVEQLIAKPFMKITKAKNHKLHASGREDRDARCLGWRPFVLEMVQPNKRTFSLSKMKPGKGVNVKELKFVDKVKVVEVKDMRPDKTYKAVVSLTKPIEKKDLIKLKKLVGTLDQQTPTRVLHRRGDLLRKRKVKSIKTKFINKKNLN